MLPQFVQISTFLFVLTYHTKNWVNITKERVKRVQSSVSNESTKKKKNASPHRRTLWEGEKRNQVDAGGGRPLGVIRIHIQKSRCKKKPATDKMNKGSLFDAGHTSD